MSSTEIVSERHAAALAITAKGIPVFPCVAGGKSPATPHGFQDRSSDPARIAAWWGADDYNIGVVPEDLGLCVIDIDTPDLPDDLAGLASVYQRTPRGGWHLFLAGSLPPTAGRFAPRVDTRGRDSYILVAPSQVGGRSYAGDLPDCWDCPALPAWFVARLAAPTVAPRSAAPGVKWDTDYAVQAAIEEIERRLAAGPPEIGEGSDGRTFKLACKLKDMGISRGKQIELLAAWWAPPHFTPEWLAAKVASAWCNGKNEPGSDPAIPHTEAFAPPQKQRIRLAVKGGARPVDWLWPGYLARGMLHILAGNPGTGKSSIAYDFAARLSTGGLWPDGTPAPRGHALLWSSEDPWDVTIEPRLRAAGADLDHIDSMVATSEEFGDGEHAFDPARDIAPLLELAASLPDLRLVVIDPIVNAVRGDDNHNNDVRRALAPLVEFAERTGAVLLGISHYAKNTDGRDPSDRVIGSRGYSALARVILGAASSDDGGERRLVRAKSNIGPSGGGIGYTLGQTMITANNLNFPAQRIVWGEALDGSARALLGALAPAPADRKLGSAKALILRLLGDGVATSQALREAAEAAGISWPTMKNARHALGALVEVFRDGDGAWQWRLAGGGAYTS